MGCLPQSVECYYQPSGHWFDSWSFFHTEWICCIHFINYTNLYRQNRKLWPIFPAVTKFRILFSSSEPKAHRWAYGVYRHLWVSLKLWSSFHISLIVSSQHKHAWDIKIWPKVCISSISGHLRGMNKHWKRTKVNMTTYSFHWHTYTLVVVRYSHFD